MGDLPGIYQVSTVCGHQTLGRSPLAAQTATLLTPGGGLSSGAGSFERARFSASALRKNKGAAASMPTKLGLPFPVKSPIQTTSTYGPTMPADQASRNPQDVPVFHATGQRPRTGGAPSSSGRGLRRSMSSVMNAASGLSIRVPSSGLRGDGAARTGRSTPWFASIP